MYRESTRIKWLGMLARAPPETQYLADKWKLLLNVNSSHVNVAGFMFNACTPWTCPNAVSRTTTQGHT